MLKLLLHEEMRIFRQMISAEEMESNEELSEYFGCIDITGDESMREYCLFRSHLELRLRSSAYQCPQCNRFAVHADGFGVSNCDACGSYFSVIQEPSFLQEASRKWLSSLVRDVKERLQKVLRR